MGTLLLTPRADARPEVTSLGDLHFRISFHPEDLRLGTASIQGVEYRTFDFPGAGRLRGPDYVGHPDLPFLSLTALLPPGTQIAEVDTVSATVITLPGTYLPAPIQPEPDPRTPQPPVPPDPRIYQSVRPYPERLGEGALDGSLRGYHLGLSRVFPVRFIGATRRIEVATSLELRVRVEPYAEAERGELRVRSSSRSRHSLYGTELAWIGRNVANPEALIPLRGQPEGKELTQDQTPYGGFLPTERPSDSGPPVACVIITDSTTVDGAVVGNLVTEFQRLVSGRLVRTLVDGLIEPGVHEATWDGLDAAGRPVPSGVYFYELELGRSRSSRKMLLLR